MKGHSYNPEGCPKCGKIHIPPFKDKKHTEETKRISGKKIGIANKGKKRTEKQKENYRDGQLGLVKSEEHCKNLSKAILGISLENRGHKLDCNCCICKAKRGEAFGEDNPFYNKVHTESTISVLSKKASDRLILGFGKVTGHFISKKNKKGFCYRSSWELMFMEILEEDESVVSYEYEPFRIKYLDENKVLRFTVPDFCVVDLCGKESIVEIRPSWRLEDERTVLGMEAVADFCKENNKKYIWINDFSNEKKFNEVFLVN